MIRSWCFWRPFSQDAISVAPEPAQWASSTPGSGLWRAMPQARRHHRLDRSGDGFDGWAWCRPILSRGRLHRHSSSTRRVTPLQPTVTGQVTSYSVSPALRLICVIPGSTPMESHGSNLPSRLRVYDYSDRDWNSQLPVVRNQIVTGDITTGQGTTQITYTAGRDLGSLQNTATVTCRWRRIFRVEIYSNDDLGQHIVIDLAGATGGFGVGVLISGGHRRLY